MSLLFCRLNSPSAFSCSLYNRRSKPLTIFVAHCWTHSSNCSSCTGKSRTGHSIPDVSHHGSVEKDNLPQPAGYASLAAVSSFCWKGTLLAHGKLHVHQDPHVFLQTCFPAGWSPACTGASAYSSSAIRTLDFPWLIYRRLLSDHFSNLSKFL